MALGHSLIAQFAHADVSPYSINYLDEDRSFGHFRQ
jgi:hypothetical protein